MDKRYEVYCLADPAFYDHPALRGGRNPDFAATDREPPPGWSSKPSGDWWHVTPPDFHQVDQGWKVHVSATMGNAEKILEAVWEYCTDNAFAFKFLCGPRTLFLRNSKYADRGSSGKLVTVYPADETELERILKELGDRLRGEPGPYILSDLRWQDGPLFVRYGGFTPRYCLDEGGNLVAAIEDPQGTLIPDRRGPVFAPPAWAPLPDVLAPQLAARNATATADLPYRIEQALHFSNGGGVYRAVDARSGEKAVLKEARPYAGLVGDGADAVTRLRRERDTLQLLAGSGVAPEVRDYFTLGDHHFLALEYIEGRSLNTYFSERFPLNCARPDPAAVTRYTDWALGIQASTEHAVSVLHARGVVFNDLHLFNIMVRPDDSVALIDFEVAVPKALSTRQVLASRAFQAPADRTGFGVDRYALACLRLALFMPLTTLLPLDRSRAAAMAEAIAAEFPAVPREFLDAAVLEITDGMDRAAPPARPALPSFDLGGRDSSRRWPELRDALAAGIKQSATPHRTDRLFPGDIRQFTHPGAGIGLAHGAAGVLYALHSTGAPIDPAHEDWLLRAAAAPPPGAHLGLYDGMHGVAYTLDLLGHSEAAQRVLSIAMDEQWRRLGADLTDGLAGIGLNLLHFAQRTGDQALRDEALAAATLIVDRLGGAEDVPTVSGGPNPRAGLMRGSSGPALLFLHLFEDTGDASWLDHAETALRQDLRRCVTMAKDGSLHVNEGQRTMPYLAHGSAGIGLVLRRFLRHRPDDGLAASAAAIRLASTSRFYVQSGLFAGRAGMILGLVPEELDQDADPNDDLLQQVRRLAWHAVRHEDTLAFPGDQLFRLSADLATGSAGVLLALGTALHDSPVHLPFLGATRPASVPNTPPNPQPRPSDADALSQTTPQPRG
jgi:serine/threonine protein kinase